MVDVGGPCFTRPVSLRLSKLEPWARVPARSIFTRVEKDEFKVQYSDGPRNLLMCKAYYEVREGRLTVQPLPDPRKMSLFPLTDVPRNQNSVTSAHDESNLNLYITIIFYRRQISTHQATASQQLTTFLLHKQTYRFKREAWSFGSKPHRFPPKTENASKRNGMSFHQYMYATTKAVSALSTPEKIAALSTPCVQNTS